MKEALDTVDQLAFVPFALFDQEAYGRSAAGRFADAGVEVVVVTADDEGVAILESAEAVFVGGGNTFRLLKTLQNTDLLGVLKRRVADGMIYMGASAGSNIASPTIKTTNDMPIVQPDSFNALGLVPFQINPHYIDSDASTHHMGETREQRLLEFLEENDTAVVGLREGAWIRVDGAEVVLGGRNGARVFRRGAEPEELATGASLAGLM